MNKTRLKASIKGSVRKLRRRMARNNLDVSSYTNSQAAKRAYSQYSALFRFRLATGSLQW